MSITINSQDTIAKELQSSCEVLDQFSYLSRKWSKNLAFRSWRLLAAAWFLHNANNVRYLYCRTTLQCQHCVDGCPQNCYIFQESICNLLLVVLDKFKNIPHVLEDHTNEQFLSIVLEKMIQLPLIEKGSDGVIPICVQEKLRLLFPPSQLGMVKVESQFHLLPPFFLKKFQMFVVTV